MSASATDLRDFVTSFTVLYLNKICAQQRDGTRVSVLQDKLQ